MSQEETKPQRRDYFIDSLTYETMLQPRYKTDIHVREVGAGLVNIEDVRELVEALKDWDNNLCGYRARAEINLSEALANFRAKNEVGK